MLNREKYPRTSTAVSRRETRIVIYDGVESDGGTNVVARVRLISDDDTVRRIKPSVPSLAPTRIRRSQLEVDYGSLSTAPYSRRNGRILDIMADLRWNQLSGTSPWSLVPGLAVTPAGYVRIVRSLDQETLCHNKLRSRIKNATANIPLAILEGAKTASWITSRAVSIAHVINHMKGKSKWERFRKAVNSLGGHPPKSVVLSTGRYGYKTDKTTLYKDPNRLPADPPNGWSSMDVANRWLEVQYALTPFLLDVVGGAKALASFLDENKLTYLSSFAKFYWFRDQTNTFVSNYPYFTGQVSHDCSSINTYKVKVNYLLDVYLAAFIQAGFVNAPAVAYELVPYSFVVDWGITFGQYLELLDATVPCKFLSGTSSWELSGYSGNANAAYKKSIAAHAVHVDVPSLVCSCYNREVLGDFPLPGIVVKSPLSPSHAATSLALIRKTFSR